MNRESPSHDLSFGKDRLPAIHLEIATLHDLKHYNIVRVHELIELEMQVVTIMSYVSSLTLLQYIQNRRMGAGTWRFPEPMVWSIFRQLVSGVLYLHDNQTIHHNLTFDNILFDSKQERIVIKDFKLAEIVPCGGTDSLGQVPSNRPKFVNPYFTAPEVLEDSKYSTAFGDVYQRGKVDVYSCGVILVRVAFKSFKEL
ncbi:kinase-like domain-containing protein [Tricladium varicosporioides]|nr:kinase-like domain-containing protein [Hymenoscyphus varicosporioides]